MMYLRICLKVCEGCGALWYRAEDCTEVYCPGCVPEMRIAARMRMLAIPPGRRSRRPGRRVRHRMGTRPWGGAA